MIHVRHVPARPRHRARRWLTGLLLLVLLMALLLAWLASMLWAWQGAPVVDLPFPVAVNGHDLGGAIDRGLGWLQALDTPARLGLVFGTALASLLLLVVLPALLVTLVLVAMAGALAVAGGLLALVLLSVALACSPLLLPLALLWWLAKPRAGAQGGRPAAVAAVTAHSAVHSVAH